MPDPTTSSDSIRWGLLGVPTSAAAHWPGLELAPGALRAAGLPAVLRSAGVDLADHGDRPVRRWRAERPDERPNNWQAALEVIVDARQAIGAILDQQQRALVVGGDCTLAIALVGAAVERFDEVGLVYVDGGQDLMIPVDHPREPILDGMGVAHLLGLPGCLPELVGVGPRRPLLRPTDVAFVGYADEEEDIHGLVPSARFPASEVVLDPAGAARRALQALPQQQLVVHVDVDVVDALDLPLADIASYGSGFRLSHLSALLIELLRDPRIVGLTLVEANPDHDPDQTSLPRLIEALAGALSSGTVANA
jgi:arginase